MSTAYGLTADEANSQQVPCTHGHVCRWGSLTERRNSTRYCVECDHISARWVKFRLSNEDYIELLHKQNHACVICGEVKKLSVDHDHVTGSVRGLLCARCNLALGLIEDGAFAEKAMKYLARKWAP